MPGTYRVLSVIFEAANQNTEFVQLDSNGEVVDFLTWAPCAERTVEGRQQKLEQEEKLLRFICEHKPLVIALGAGNVACERFYKFVTNYMKVCIAA